MADDFSGQDIASPFGSDQVSLDQTVRFTPADNSSITEVPIDAEGAPFSFTKDGKFVPANRGSAVDANLLSQLTDQGLNTRSLLEQDTDSILDVNQFPGNTLGVSPSSGGGGSNGPSSGDPELDAAIQNASRIVGQQLWQIKVTLYNHKQPKYELRPHAIKQLVINDDFLLWPLRGSIVIDNRMEGFERSYGSDTYYHIRGDSRDEIFIEIWPTPFGGTELPDNVWKIKLHANIYDVEDMPSENMTTKMKKLYFWDKNFQRFMEENTQWGTATGKRFISPPCPEPKAHMPDNLRSMFTGEAIASLISDAGYEQYLDLTNWDMGKGKINFVAKSGWTIWDCILYLLKYQISNDDKEDICILDWDRAKEKLTLIPMYKYFDQAGKDSPGVLQMEHLFYETRGDITGTSVPSPWKAPYLEEPSKTTDIKMENYGSILNYRFSQTSGLDNAKAFVTKPVYSHWHQKKQFDIDVKENEIASVRDDVFKTNYVDKLLGSDPLMVLNLTKVDQYTVDPQFSPVSITDSTLDRKIRSLEGKGRILYGGIFLSHCISVRLQGSTHRMTGTFIGIDRLTENTDTTYDYQVCGQYLVVGVNHIFQNQKYVTDLTMVKIHSYDKLPNFEEIY